MAITDNILINNIKNIDELSISFNYPESNIIVITGKNGKGKTSVVKSFGLISNPLIFSKSSGMKAIRPGSYIRFEIQGFENFEYTYNPKIEAIDTRDTPPKEGAVLAELPIPYGKRFDQFTLISKNDSDIRAKIAASDYKKAEKLIDFLSRVYSSNKFSNLNSTTVKGNEFYFILKDNDYYIREDHFSSGEFFLIQLFRLITSGAKLILIDELDVALDASAQTKIYPVIKELALQYKTRIVLVSHSLAFMETVEDGGLYYLEEDDESKISLEQRSFAYIKSDLYGFKGYDKYILTEDSVLENFIEFLIKKYSIISYYQYQVIGAGGSNQLETLIKKNDSKKIFCEPSCLTCIVDADIFERLKNNYTGPTAIHSCPFTDIEKYIHQNHREVLGSDYWPNYQESVNQKRASKTYWKWLQNTKGLHQNALFELLCNNNKESVEEFSKVIRDFLTLEE